MKTKLTNFALVSMLVLTTFNDPAGAQELSADDLARRTVERRAVEAVIWGIPA